MQNFRLIGAIFFGWQTDAEKKYARRTVTESADEPDASHWSD